MKKFLMILLAGILVVFIGVQALAADLQWDYPADWTSITGYTVYFTDGMNNYNKTISKTDVTEDGTTVTYPGIEDKLNLAYNVQYSIHITAYNDAGESEPSNTITHTRDSYLPPVDVLPPPLPGSSSSPGNVRVQ